MAASIIPLKVGDSCTFVKTVTEADVVIYGGITGDLSKVHFNEEYAKTTRYKTRIAHGTLIFSFASTASTLIQDRAEHPIPSASYGYNRVRFPAAVYFGDTITTTYTVTRVDDEDMKTYADVVMTNQHGDVVCVCEHILKYFDPNE